MNEDLSSVYLFLILNVFPPMSRTTGEGAQEPGLGRGRGTTQVAGNVSRLSGGGGDEEMRSESVGQ